MDGVAKLSLSLLCCLRFNEFQSCLMGWSYLSVCLCWTVSETMTVMQFKGNIGWSQGKDGERERLSGSEWRGNRGGEVGKKTMKRHRRMNMTSSDSPESQWGSLKSKYIRLPILTANITKYFYSEPLYAHIGVRSVFQDAFVMRLSTCHSAINLKYASIFSIYDI